MDSDGLQAFQRIFQRRQHTLNYHRVIAVIAAADEPELVRQWNPLADHEISHRRRGVRLGGVDQHGIRFQAKAPSRAFPDYRGVRLVHRPDIKRDDGATLPAAFQHQRPRVERLTDLLNRAMSSNIAGNLRADFRGDVYHRRPGP
ncbi:MAG: hypothetical protein BWY76_01111 [bacterium ADurb.Bin429]|nr:MAG: hypothetical protein BWY76_01111 [bacterium ADurb.Bin429]